MSSRYSIFCLSHDPAILIVSGLQSEEELIQTFKEGFQDHQRCDFMVIRVSDGITQYGCPGSILPDRDARVCSGHTHIKWVDADWLKLLAYIRPDDSKVAEKIKNRPRFRCWSEDRMRRLRYELDIV